MTVHVKVGGIWKTASAVYNKVGGVWKTASDMPVKIAGVWKTGNLTPKAGWYSITTLTMTGDTPVTISSIPQDYTDLRIVTHLKGASSVTPSTTITMAFNGDTTASNYAITVSNVFGSSVGNNTSAAIPYVNMLTSSTASYVSPGIVEIFDYANTSKRKTLTSLTGYDVNSSMYNTTNLMTGRWNNTAAITSITFTAGVTSMVGTISLYGFKAAS